MAHIVTLKDNNDEISYPITPIDAVFTDTSVTLENMIDAKADTDLTNVVNGSVTTNKIANSAVTSDKIDWATMGEEVPLSSFGSAVNGYTLKSGQVYKMGPIIFGNIIVSSDHNISGNEKFANISSAYTPRVTVNSFCALASSDEWSAPYTGYFYCGANGDGYLRDTENHGCRFAKILFIWMH